MPDQDVKPTAFKLPTKAIGRLRRMAFWEDRRLSEIVLAAIENYIDLYEGEKGKYQPIPDGETVQRGRPPNNPANKAS